MKKKLLVLVALLVLAVSVFAACGGSEPTREEVQKSYEKANYTVSSSNISGVWVLTAIEKDASSLIPNTVIITKYSTTGAADDAEKALKDGNTEYLRRGDVIAVGTGDGLTPFKNA
jgi:maltose-binding protein MalE